MQKKITVTCGHCIYHVWLLCFNHPLIFSFYFWMFKINLIYFVLKHSIAFILFMYFIVWCCMHVVYNVYSHNNDRWLALLNESKCFIALIWNTKFFHYSHSYYQNDIFVSLSVSDGHYECNLAINKALKVVFTLGHIPQQFSVFPVPVCLGRTREAAFPPHTQLPGEQQGILSNL